MHLSPKISCFLSPTIGRLDWQLCGHVPTLFKLFSIKTAKGDAEMTQKDTNFFNIDDMSQGIARTLTDGITTRIFPGEKAMISVVRIEPNAVGAIHSHPQEQWGLMLEGSAIRIQDGEEIKVKKGDFWVSPGGLEHGVIGGPDGAVILDVFSPPREEYTRPGSGFGTE
jgi:quercetin dioxygenase-like cupin family protein